MISIQCGKNCREAVQIMLIYTVSNEILRVFIQIGHFELIMMISFCQIQKYITFLQILLRSNPH